MSDLIKRLRARRDFQPSANVAMMDEGPDDDCHVAADRIEALETALKSLLAASSEVSRRGASTGLQWVKLSSAIGSACATMENERQSAP